MENFNSNPEAFIIKEFDFVDENEWPSQTLKLRHEELEQMIDNGSYDNDTKRGSEVLREFAHVDFELSQRDLDIQPASTKETPKEVREPETASGEGTLV